MTKKKRKKAEPVPVLTAEDIKVAMRKGAKGAAELHRQIAPLFRLNEHSAGLRLR